MLNTGAWDHYFNFHEKHEILHHENFPLYGSTVYLLIYRTAKIIIWKKKSTPSKQRISYNLTRRELASDCLKDLLETACMQVIASLPGSETRRNSLKLSLGLSQQNSQ